jgi:hypothetical protein
MKQMRFLLLALMFLPLASCEKDPIEDRLGQDIMIIEENLSRLGLRVSTIRGGQPMPVYPVDFNGAIKSLKSDTFSSKYQIYLRAEVDPPVYKGKTLQASHIKIVGNNAFVTYNTRGPEFLGGVDVFDVSDIENPVLIQGVIFPEKDISSIDIDPLGDGNNNFIYLTGAYNPDINELGLKSPAVVERFIANKANKFKHLDEVRNYFDLESFAGNDVRHFIHGDNRVYVTSGSGGGLSIMGTGLTRHSHIPIPYARSIDTDGTHLVVYSAEDNKLIVMNMDGVIQREIVTGGEHFAEGKYLEAKSIVRLKGDLAFVAAGTGGMEVYNILTGEKVAYLQRPEIPQDAEFPLNYVTNGVSVNNDLVLVANGGSGVHIALHDEGLSSIGKFMFENGSSANFIEARDNKIFVATGLGGLKILELVKVETCTVSVKYPSTGSPAYFPEVYVTEAGVYNGTYRGWCAQSTVRIEQFTEYPAQIFSSLGHLTGKDVVEHPENLDKVNWILNQGFVGRESDAGGKFIFGDVQYAIWDLISVLPPLVSTPHDPARVNEILTLAGIHGPEFKLQCGHVYAIIFAIEDKQNVIIEYPYPCED